jgi:hypothetical protein
VATISNGTDYVPNLAVKHFPRPSICLWLTSALSGCSRTVFSEFSNKPLRPTQVLRANLPTGGLTRAAMNRHSRTIAVLAVEQAFSA